MQNILDAANDDGITDIMKAHVRFADALGLKATPSYLIHDVAIQGHPGRKSLKGVIDVGSQMRQGCLLTKPYPPDCIRMITRRTEVTSEPAASDACHRLIERLDRNRHVMRIGVDDGLAVTNQRDMAPPEDQSRRAAASKAHPGR